MDKNRHEFTKSSLKIVVLRKKCVVSLLAYRAFICYNYQRCVEKYTPLYFFVFYEVIEEESF